MAVKANVLVDTSVWIDFFSGEETAVAGLRNLIDANRITICGQILQEVLQGSRDEKAFEKLCGQMQIWNRESEEPDDFVEAARIFAQLRWAGVTITPTDCLIAAVAIRRKLVLFTRDSDFDYIEGLTLYPVSEGPRQ
jgi:predicted nucleic acid-binding protein